MRIKAKYFLPLILIVFLLGGCTTISMQMTKEGTGLILMKTWDDLEATYRAEASMPNLSEGFKKILRNKREMLIGSFYAIKMYNEYIELGFVASQTLGDLYVKYLNIAEVPFADLVSIYGQYMKTKKLDAVILDQIINMMLAQLTSMALDKI